MKRSACVLGFALSACSKPPPASPEVGVTTVPTTAAAAPTDATRPPPDRALPRMTTTPQGPCEQALSSFGDRAAESWGPGAFDTERSAELAACNAARTSSEEHEHCSGQGRAAAFEACVLQCASTEPIPTPYVPGDVVDGCAVRCAEQQCP